MDPHIIESKESKQRTTVGPSVDDRDLPAFLWLDPLRSRRKLKIFFVHARFD
ncbi:hypothetical protein COLO4_29127 [Corchorus olitorius]|uniref:Uncharacterized protein n=1 Tax=Corchorus olitorius TaxID=93759 RepID=A0A1R3HG32_9ROSI|nr:hypothetical protein COLO4_29127 [Corchorus olitorius]